MLENWNCGLKFIRGMDACLHFLFVCVVLCWLRSSEELIPAQRIPYHMSTKQDSESWKMGGPGLQWPVTSSRLTDINTDRYEILDSPSLKINARIIKKLRVCIKHTKII